MPARCSRVIISPRRSVLAADLGYVARRQIGVPDHQGKAGLALRSLGICIESGSGWGTCRSKRSCAEALLGPSFRASTDLDQWLSRRPACDALVLAQMRPGAARERK
jgi:hypothetical protein